MNFKIFGYDFSMKRRGRGQTNEHFLRDKDDLRLFHQAAEIYSSFSASRGFHFNSGDGLDRLLSKGLAGILKKMIFLAILNEKSYFHLVTGDTADASLAFNSNFGFETFAFGEVWVERSSFRNVHETRVVKMKSSFLNFHALEKSSCLQNQVVNETANFLKVNNFTFLKSASLPSVSDITALDQEEIRKNLKGAFKDNNHVMILGQKDELVNITRQASPIKDAMDVILADATLFSGIPKDIMFPNSAAGADAGATNYDLFFLNIENICQLMIRPFVNDILGRLKLESDWDFKPIKPKTEKEVAEIEERQIKTSLAILDLNERLKTAELDPELKRDFENQIKNYMKNN